LSREKCNNGVQKCSEGSGGILVVFLLRLPHYGASGCIPWGLCLATVVKYQAFSGVERKVVSVGVWDGDSPAVLSSFFGAIMYNADYDHGHIPIFIYGW